MALVSIITILLKLFIECESYDLKCPFPSHWMNRASSYCSYHSNYTCLFNISANSYAEKCYKPEPIYKGFKFVWQPKLNTGNCKFNRYQPINFWTNRSSDCILKKSKCSDHGHILVNNGSGSLDASCRCNINKGYIYINEPTDVCSCDPSKEDCSCYKCGTEHSKCSDVMATRLSMCAPVIIFSAIDSEDGVVVYLNDTVHEQYEQVGRGNAAFVGTLILTVLFIIVVVSIIYRELTTTRCCSKEKDDSNLNDKTGSEEETAVKYIDGDEQDISIEIDEEKTDMKMAILAENKDHLPDKQQGDGLNEAESSSCIIKDGIENPNLPIKSGTEETGNHYVSEDIDDEQTDVKTTLRTETKELTNNEKGDKSSHACKDENGGARFTTRVEMEDKISNKKGVLGRGNQDYVMSKTVYVDGDADGDKRSNVINLRSSRRGILDSGSDNFGASEVGKPNVGISASEENARIRNAKHAMEKRYAEFFESTMFFNAIELLKSHRFVTIIGASGDGKSSLAEHLALYLKLNDGNYEYIFVHDPTIFEQKLKVNEQQVFIINDPFGKQILDEEILSAWVKLSKNLKDSISQDHTVILSTIRKTLYRANERRINETMLTETIFDLSKPENQLTGEEKIGLLKKCLSVNEIPSDLLIKIREQGYFPGYPLWCHVVSSEIGIRKDYYSISNIFSPLNVIRNMVKDIRDTNPYHYCSLVLAMLNKNAMFDINNLIVCERDYGKDGKQLQTKIFNIMKSCNVDFKSNDCSIEMKNAFEHLEGVFFINDKYYYKIRHDSITDCVAEMYGGSNIHNILEYSDSGFLREYVRTKSATDVDDLSVCIQITSEEYCELLAKRFKQEIEKGNQVDVFLNPSISDISFQPYFINALVTLSLSELKPLMYMQPPSANNDLSIIVKYTKFVLDIAILSSTPFHWLCKLGLIDVFNFVIGRVGDKKVFIEQLPGNTTPLHFAAGYGHLEIVKKLVDIGVDVNVKSSLKVMSSDKIGEFYSGFTPLLYAARQNHPKVAEFLLQNHANPDIVRDHGGSPMLLAADRGHTEVVKILLEYGGDPDIFCDHGTTPLILAAQEGHLETVKVLVEKSKDLNKRKFNSNISALFGAAKNGHLECVKCLVERGALTNLKGENELTPLEIALKNNHKHVAEYLRNKAAE